MLQEYSPYNTANSSFNALAYSADCTKLYASDPSGAVLVMNVAHDGRLSGATKIALPVGDPALKDPAAAARRQVFIPLKGQEEMPKTGDPEGIAVSRDGRRLYVAMSMNNSLAVVDLERSRVIAEIPVGKAPHAVVIIGSSLMSTNQGGRIETASDYTNVSAGSLIVADAASGRPITGTVSVVDLEAGKSIEMIPVGIEPTAIRSHDNLLFVANTNSDTISIIDPQLRRIIKTISIEPFRNAPFGSSPNDLLGLPDGRLVVSLGANNVLAVYAWKGPTLPVSFVGFIPTAWYPSAMAA